MRRANLMRDTWSLTFAHYVKLQRNLWMKLLMTSLDLTRLPKADLTVFFKQASETREQ